MSPTIEEQIERLKNTIAEMEDQHDALGDNFVRKAVEPLYEKLAELNHLLESSKSPPPETPIQQRKLITILFMDIVGSTSIIQHMDPEEVSEIFDANLKRLAKPVEDFGGRVTSFMGDGFMAIFGAPTAREDDPERAVRAGLAVIQRSEEIARELEKNWQIHDFKVRVGVNTGLVILGGETEGEDTTKGPAVHLAARLQSAAPPGGILVSHDTYRYIRGVFNVEAWEPLKIKGFDEPVQVYHILNAKPRAFRSYSRGVEGVETRMVGRHDELKYLQDALLSAIEDDEGQIVTIMGEAGVGKSRLLYEFQNWIELQPPPAVRFYEGRAHQEAQGMPLRMLRDLFEFRFQLQENDTSEAVREKVASGFSEVFGEGDEGQMRAAILGQWLGFDFSTSPHLQGVLTDPEQLRNRGLMYLGEYFKGLCAQAPVVVFLEDIHWADDSSLDALNWLGERLTYVPLLFVCAARHSLLERRPYWGEGLTYHHHLDLEPLSKRESHQLVGEILKLAENVPPELFELVVEGAEGNPFYVEELVKMLVEDGVVVKGEEAWQVLPARLSEIKVPPTLAGVLQARLESLPPEEQRVLQQASVVGRLFWDQVVAHIQAAEGGKPQFVTEALTSLRGREMVYRREASAFTDTKEYLFKHDILREVTYESVLRKLRRRYHGLVADWLISQVGGRANEYSGLIAGHLLQASRKDQAGAYYLQAGQAALASFANAEAEGYFRQALEQPLEDIQKASCLGGLSYALFTQGSGQEAVVLLHQGIELYLKMGDTNAASDLYTGISSILWYSDYQKAWEACQEGLQRLEDAPESPGMAHLLAEAGRAALFLSRPAEEVHSLCQRAIEMAERQADHEARAEATITIALCTPDFDKAIPLLLEAVAISEANKLWNTASRAHINLGVVLRENFQNLETIYQQHLQALDILIRIGNSEGQIFELDNLAETLVELGHLKFVEDKLKEILRNSTAPQDRIDKYLDNIHSELPDWTGEWTLALEYNRHRRGEARETSQYQTIVNRNLRIVNICLELNRFRGMADLSEAEAALRENIEIGWLTPESRILTTVISSRAGRFADAHECLADVIRETDQPIPKPIQMFLFQAKAELARAEGRWDEAAANCQALIDVYQAGVYRWKHARQLINLADVLISRDLPGDREQAQQVYRQSLDMFTEMDAPGYIQVLEERLGDTVE
jgi:class 3 adenylate cyclase/tetratricopeptide (TPR) repeat protein